MNSEQIIQLTGEHVMHTYGRLPIALVRGEGTRVWDADGRVYLDFLTGLAVNSLGHRHPRVVEAVVEAAGSLLHTSNLYHIRPQAELAAKLAEVSGLDRAFFCNSGAEANEAAIKLARRFAKRHVGADRFEIVTANGSFHGRTLATVTATGQPKYHEGFEPLPAGFRYVPLNDIAALEAAVGEATCAVLLEPIQGEGGVHPCTPEYLRAARALCDRHGIPLILDEVQTGMGRTGRMFAFEHYDVRPDILTLAKALGGGVPIGAMLATERVAQGFEPGSHASTFGGNPLATTVALAVVETLVEERLPARAARAGARIVEAVKGLAKRHPDKVGAVRGMGLMIGVELQVSGTPILAAAQQRGLLLNVIADRVLRLLPPLNVTDAEIDEAMAILSAVFDELDG